MCRSEEDLQRDREEERGRRASLLGVVSGRAGAGRAEGRACVHKRVCVHKCACTGMHRCACHLCARVHARTGVCTQAGCAHKGTCTWGARGVCLCVRVSVHMEGARTGVHARRACARARDMHEWVCLRKRGVHIRTGGVLVCVRLGGHVYAGECVGGVYLCASDVCAWGVRARECEYTRAPHLSLCSPHSRRPVPEGDPRLSAAWACAKCPMGRRTPQPPHGGGGPSAWQPPHCPGG